MLSNYLKIAFRKIRQHRLYSTINILGLTLGIGAALLLLSWTWSEIEMDRFHEKGDRLYQALPTYKFDGKINTVEQNPYLLVGALVDNYPEVAKVTAIRKTEFAFELGEERSLEKGIYTDSSFFEMFSYPILAGDYHPIYTKRYRIAISARLAEKIFGHQDYYAMVGNSLRIWQNRTYEISAIFENPPANSSQQFNFVFDIADHYLNNPNQKHWFSYSERVFVLLRDGVDKEDFQKKIANILPLSDDETEEDRTTLQLQPYADHYLYGRFENGKVAGGRIDYIKMILFAAFLLLSIACINFVNLTTARATRQAKEVGVRKVIGATRKSLIIQFLAEAFLTVIFATILAVMLTEFSFGYFTQATGRELSFAYGHPAFWAIIVGIVLVTGILSGAYPAFFLSGIGIQKVLKNKSAVKGGNLRKALVVLQFTASIMLVLGALTVQKQIDYVQNKNIGINRSHILSFKMYQQMYKNQNAFVQEIQKIPGVKSFSRLHTSPIEVNNKLIGLKINHQEEKSEASTFSMVATDHNFKEVFKPRLVAGEDFVDFGDRDTTTYMVNEAMLQAFGWENPIGMHLQTWGTSGTIVGVVENFNFRSIHHEITPLILVNRPDKTNFMYVETLPGEDATVLAGLEKVHRKFAPAFPFEYKFMDEQYAQLYANEKQTGMLAGWFAIIAVILSCLGLLGLVAFLAEQKSKEIGIRKVLGASITHIIQLLSKEFVKLIILAIIIGIPVAWYFLNQWLQEFAYATTLSWTTILSSVGILFFMMIITVGFQSIRAATSDPVKVLKNE